MTEQPTPGLERTLLWLATGYRVFGAAWMALIGMLILRSDDAGRPGVLATSLAVVIVWTALGVILALQRPLLLRTWAFVALDIAVGVFSVVVAAWAESSIIYAAGYPLAAVFGAIYAKGTAGGAAAAVALTGAALSRLAWVVTPDEPNQFSIAISYLFSAVAATGAIEVLRRSDESRVAAEEALVVAQAARARADERAEVAAHLHDSVLQTLALIQRESTSSDPVRQLARRQERELRQWLYRSEDAADQGFRDAINAMAAEVDDMSAVEVEAVVVGDRPMDAPHEALVRAGREAAVNAIKHSEVPTVSIYAEVAPGTTKLFVKDRGVGFDVGAVPDDRRGIADSIVGRIERHGGSATVMSTPGQGTEVRLTMPEEATS
ncbi:sensor histidine kinase [Actinomycetota bacterium]